jgi:energy-coupling factor transporter transmembrane protein EcfT
MNRIDPRITAAACVWFVACLTLTPALRVAPILSFTLIYAIAAIAAKERRVFPIIGVVAACCLGLAIQRCPASLVMPAQTSVRLILSTLAVALFCRVTPFSEQVAAIRAFGAPPLACTLLLLARHNAEMLLEHGTGAHRSFIVRCPRLSRTNRVKAYAAIAGSLTMRLAERSEKLAMALDARGFRGSLPVVPLPTIPPDQALWLACYMAMVAAAAFWRP